MSGRRLLGSSFGRHSGTSLGSAALLLQLTKRLITCQVRWIQQHQEEEVGHGVSWSACSLLSYSTGETGRASVVLKRVKSEQLKPANIARKNVFLSGNFIISLKIFREIFVHF